MFHCGGGQFSFELDSTQKWPYTKTNTVGHKTESYNFFLIHRSGEQHQNSNFLLNKPAVDATPFPHLALLDPQTAQSDVIEPYHLRWLLTENVNGSPSLPERRMHRLQPHSKMIDELLCYRTRLSHQWPAIAPAKARHRILKMCYDAPTAGHCGQHTSLVKVSQRFCWTWVKSDVRKYVAPCTTCQLRKTPLNPERTECNFQRGQNHPHSAFYFNRDD